MYLGLLNQTVNIRRESAVDGYGKKTFDAGTAYKARVELKDRRRMLPGGEILVTNAKIFLPSTAVVDTDDLVTYDSVTYRVFSKNVAVGGAGQTHHITLEVTKWPV